MAENHIVYELQGESLAQAKTLYRLLAGALKANPVQWEGKNLAEIGRLYDQFFAGFFSDVQKNHPDLYAGLGLAEQALQIQSYRNGYPRAYADRPACYIDPMPPHRIYMFSPVDYKGRHFAPADAVRKTAAEQEKIGQSLWAGGWSDPITLIPGKRSGTALPVDFDSAADATIETSHLASDKPYRFFRAEGKSLALLQELDRAKEHYSKRVNQLFQAVDNLLPRLLEAGAVDGAGPGDEIYAGKMLGTDAQARPRLEISIRRKMDGQPYALRDNPWFKVRPRTAGSKDYYVEPITDTPEGLAFYDFVASVPDQPEQKEFPAALLSTDIVVPADQYDGMFGPLNKPIIRHFPQGIFLAYRAGPGSAYHPPGCTEISPAEFIWMDADESDRNLGIVPPPSPFLSYPAPSPRPAP